MASGQIKASRRRSHQVIVSGMTTGTKTFDIRVHGCKTNQYDAQQIRRLLELGGLREVGDGESADVVVVHTCAVTQSAVRKSRSSVRQLSRSHEGAEVVVTGCAAEHRLLQSKEEGLRQIPPREGWLTELNDTLFQAGVLQTPVPLGETADQLMLEEFTGHARAFLKVQDGCDIGCTFCIVPRLRRKPRDKPLDVAVQEARQLVHGGHQEIVVTGISVGLYGQEGGYRVTLADLLRELVQIPGLKRLRMSSLHPNELTPDLLDVWSSSEVIMPHFHLSLQSGSNHVLREMHRGYTAEEFLDAVERARACLDRPAFNTDVIVGFPGETETCFEETMELSRQVGFSRMHVFPYSPRPGTQAERRKSRAPGSVVKERSQRLRELADRMARDYHQMFVGQDSEVLVELWDPGREHYLSYTERYIPVSFVAPPGLRGDIVRVSLTGADEHGATGVYRETLSSTRSE